METVVALLPVIVVVACVLLGVFVAIAIFLRHASGDRTPEVADLSIDLEALSTPPPDGQRPSVEVYGVPVQLAVVVMAPAGRGVELPGNLEMPRVIDNWIPGLMRILKRHQPAFRRWPNQLSTTGFSHTFFSNVRLPGDRGKDTRWCSVCGRIRSGDGQYLVGLAFAAATPNGLSEISIEQEGQWLDVIRIR
ncbi:MAG: hypothetical protein QGG36_18660 [Pirellulaceae bacterium]|jgi:hypothetical protein|nr:hypothetical protein [Pirellulaceae bacterium]